MVIKQKRLKYFCKRMHSAKADFYIVKLYIIELRKVFETL